ncbi:MAG: aminopeptidase [Cytophagaceae bacterium]
MCRFTFQTNITSILRRLRIITGLIFQGFFFLIFCYCLFHAELVTYGLKQGKGQLNIIMKTSTVEEALKDTVLNPEEKEKIRLIQDVKQYSTDSLGYKPSASYTTFYDQRNSASLWVVTASEAYSLTAYTWKFPYLGEVSYKGYFDYMAGLNEFLRLKGEGYDVEMGPVSAWSTLGWFRDPILSNMLKRSKGRLAELIFHELFHNTYYAKSSVELNENLANFIAHKATLLYLRRDSLELNKYLRIRYDDSLYTAFILGGAKQLDSLYQVIGSFSLEKKMASKKNMLYSIYTKATRLKLFYPFRYTEANKDLLLTKSAYFQNFKRYDELYDSLNLTLKNRFGNDLKRMIEDLRSN